MAFYFKYLIKNSEFFYICFINVMQGEARLSYKLILKNDVC